MQPDGCMSTWAGVRDRDQRDRHSAVSHIPVTGLAVLGQLLMAVSGQVCPLTVTSSGASARW